MASCLWSLPEARDAHKMITVDLDLRENGEGRASIIMSWVVSSLQNRQFGAVIEFCVSFRVPLFSSPFSTKHCSAVCGLGHQTCAQSNPPRPVSLSCLHH